MWYLLFLHAICVLVCSRVIKRGFDDACMKEQKRQNALLARYVSIVLLMGSYVRDILISQDVIHAPVDFIHTRSLSNLYATASVIFLIFFKIQQWKIWKQFGSALYFLQVPWNDTENQDTPKWHHPEFISSWWLYLSLFLWNPCHRGLIPVILYFPLNYITIHVQRKWYENKPKNTKSKNV